MLTPCNLPISALGAAVSRAMAQQGSGHKIALKDGLVVTFDGAKRDESAGTLILTGHVTATYDLTTITCEKLTLWSAEERGRAEGKTEIIDPDVSAECSGLEFNWRDRTGHATNISLNVDGAQFTASDLQITPGKWTLQDATGTFSHFKRPTYRLWARQVTLTPGDKGTAHRVFFELFGRKIGPIANIDFNLNRRVTGWKIPSFANRRGVGFGFTWDSSVMLGHHAAIGAIANTFPKRALEGMLQFSYSPLDPDQSPFQIAPRSGLGEFAGEGWFTSIDVKKRTDEYDDLTRRRSSFSLSSRLNLDTIARKPDSLNVTEPLDLSMEFGGKTNDWGYAFTGHLQRVRDEPTASYIDRFAFLATVKPPDIGFGPISLTSRFDTYSTLSHGGHYLFGRAETGLVYHPYDFLNLGVAIGLGGSVGASDFDFDRIPYNRQLIARIDYARGPYTARFIWKWDLMTHELYDREYELAILADGFEPFISSRSFPSDFRIGLRFRFDAIGERLSRREVQRKQAEGPDQSSGQPQD